MVRSNVEANIGYLRTENRVCVALSRAKKGFFMIGNMDILSKYSPLWQKVKKNLEKLDAIGTIVILLITYRILIKLNLKLELYCGIHVSLTTWET